MVVITPPGAGDTDKQPGEDEFHRIVYCGPSGALRAGAESGPFALLRTGIGQDFQYVPAGDDTQQVAIRPADDGNPPRIGGGHAIGEMADHFVDITATSVSADMMSTRLRSL